MPNDEGGDRRVRRTRRQLRHAIATLVHEKPLDAVAVKEILARADVGRSTFYAHFRDKEELLGSAIRELLQAGEAGPSARPGGTEGEVLGFSHRLLQHVEHHLDTAAFQAGPSGRQALHEHLRRELVALVERRLRRVRGERRVAEGAIPVELVARHVAATFLLVLDWWADQRPRSSAEAADAHFRALVEPALR